MKNARYVLLILAIVFLGIYAYDYLERAAYQAGEAQAFDRRLSTHRTEAATPVTHRRSMARALAPGKPRYDDAAIGRISIPKLHLTAMVREGIDDYTLQRAVGHIPATALPGESGTVGVAGHRDTFFRSLKDLQTNDYIYFSTLDGDYKYQVDSFSIVEPENTGVLRSGDGNGLTIVTCYPFDYIGSAPRRFIVRARQID